MNTHKIDVFAKSMSEVEVDCIEWAKEIEKKYRPDLIVFIAKSGFLFAKPLSEYFGCPMVDISVSRPGSNRKDIMRRFIPRIPQWLLFEFLRSKSNYSYQNSNKDRKVLLSDRFKKIDWKHYNRILIVDDSTDTGWSLLSVKEELKRRFSGDIRTASYCVIDISKDRVDVEYYRYRNTIVVTATSRYSKEYRQYNYELDCWLSENNAIR